MEDSNRSRNRRTCTSARASFSSAFQTRVSTALRSCSPENQGSVAALRELVFHKSSQPDVKLVQRLLHVFKRLLSCKLGDHDMRCILDLLVAMLFEPGAKQLHRQLLSGLQGFLTAPTEGLMLEAFAREAAALVLQLCDGEMGTGTERESGLAVPAVCLAQAWKAIRFVRPPPYTPPPCVAGSMNGIARALLSALKAVQSAPNAAAAHSDDIQEAFATLIFLAQVSSAELCLSCEGTEAVLLSAKCGMCMLQGTSLLREAASAAAVLLATCLAFPAVPPCHLASTLGEALAAMPEAACAKCTQDSLVEAAWAQEGWSVAQQLCCISPFALACAIRGLVASLPPEVLCSRVQVSAAADACASPLKAFPDGHLSRFQRDGCQGSWVLLTDGFLAQCAASIEGCSDLHVKFNSFAAMAVALSRHAAMLRQDAAQAAEGVARDGMTDSKWPDLVTTGRRQGLTQRVSPPLLTVGCVDRIAQIVVAHMDESLRLIAAQSTNVFSSLCEILALQAQGPGSARADPAGVAEAAGARALQGLQKRLLSLPFDSKARYALLAPLVQHTCASGLLPGTCSADLVRQAILALPTGACTTASAFLRRLLPLLRDACVNAQPDKALALREWRVYWLGPTVEALLGSDAMAARSIATYFLAHILREDPASLHLLLGMLAPAVASAAPAPGPRQVLAASGTASVAAVVAVLRVARRVQHVHVLDEVVLERSSASTGVPEATLYTAAAHHDAALRLDMLELAALSVRSASVPTSLELDIVKKQLVLCIRTSTVAEHNKWVSVMEKLLMRIRGAAYAALKLASQHEEQDPAVRRIEAFLQWLSGFLLDSLYVGAARARRHLAMHLLHALLSTFREFHVVAHTYMHERRGLSPSGVCPSPSTAAFSPFHSRVMSLETIQTLLRLMGDTWESMRAITVRVLRCLPMPLAGFQKPEQLLELVRVARSLLERPRVYEADAGAQLLAFLESAYAECMGWTITVFPEAAVQPSPCSAGQVPHSQSCVVCPADAKPGENALASRLDFLSSCASWLHDVVKAGRDDMVAACRSCFVHGPLMLLRHAVPGIPWAQVAASTATVERARSIVCSVLRSALDAAVLSLPNLDGHINVGAGDVTLLDVELDAGGREEAALAPDTVVLVNGSWTSMKEISLLLAELVQCLPVCSGDASGVAAGILDAVQVASIGGRMVGWLSVLKHNGAVEKVQCGFLQLCRHLLQSPQAALHVLPAAWLAQLMQSLRRPAQSQSDINRRSAGLPVGILAVLLAEPAGATKALLPAAMRGLLDIASGSEAVSQPWPRVHAFNCLRAVFESAALAADTSAFFAEGVEAAVAGMAAAEWEVRNSAALAMVALTIRTLGFKNDLAEEGTRRGVTSLDFLRRYPSLHRCLLAELAAAGRQLATAGTRPLPASLQPVLVLLSRLQPSVLPMQGSDSTTRGGEALMESLRAVTRLLSAPQMHVRKVAARALCGLVAVDALPAFVTRLLTSLPATPATAHEANGMHGKLLAAEALIRVNLAASGEARRVGIVMTLTPALLQRRDLLDPGSHGIPALALALAQCLQAALEASPEVAASALHAHGVPQDLLSTLRATEPRHPRLPMWALWLKQVTRLLCGSPLQASMDTGALASVALGCPVVEARAEALRCWHRGALASGRVDSAVAACLRGSLDDLLSAQQHAKVRRRALQLVALLWRAPDLGTGAGQREATLAAAEQDVARMHGVLCGEGRVDTDSKLCALKCMAAAMRVVLGGSAIAAAQTHGRYMEHFLRAIEGWSRPAEAVDCRAAACEALSASGLLSLVLRAPEATLQPGGLPLPLPGLLLTAWRVQITFLEDEDYEIRLAAASGAGEVLEAFPGRLDQLSESCSVQGSASMLYPEAVLRGALELLAQCSPQLPGSVSLLAEWAMPEGARLQARRKSALCGCGPRLFDKEEANWHHEPLLLAELALRGLREVARLRLTCECSDVTAPLMRAAHFITASCDVLASREAEALWAVELMPALHVLEAIAALLQLVRPRSLSPDLVAACGQIRRLLEACQDAQHPCSAWLPSDACSKVLSALAMFDELVTGAAQANIGKDGAALASCLQP